MKTSIGSLIVAIMVCCASCCAGEAEDAGISGASDSAKILKEEIRALPEDYQFNVHAITPEEDWKKIEVHGFFEITSPVQGRDDESQQPSTHFFDENELTLWLGKRITRELSFNAEVEIQEGFKKYVLETFSFDYRIMDDLLVFRMGKFKYPFGIERFVEDGPLDKLVDRPLPSIRIIPGTYSDIGGMFCGSVPMRWDTKLKYEIALTNGLEGPDPEDVQQIWDNNGNKAIGGRIGYECLPGLELGASYTRGKYDRDSRLDMDFAGTDVQYKRGNWEVRGEYVAGRVEQDRTDGGDYRRDGYYLQTAYRHPFNRGYLRYLEGVLRFDSADPNQEITDGTEADRLAVGLNYSPMEHVELKFEHEIENEPGETIHGKTFVQAIFRW